MTDKEIAEIRRRYNPEKSSITRVRGCYVNDKSEILSEFDQSLGLMSGDEAGEMLTILKKTLSGTVGKNLIDIEFSNKQVLEGEEHGLLMRLRDSELGDSEAVKKLYERIIGAAKLESSYVILLAYDKYDVFSYTKDGARSEESTTVFSYVLCSICPLKLTKPALSYQSGDNPFRNLSPSAVVAFPELGFMFPTFDNRTANIYNALCYTKNIALSREEFAGGVFGCPAPMPAAEQKAAFDSVIRDSVGEQCSYGVVSGVRDRICDMLEERRENKVPEPLLITKSVMRELLDEQSVSGERLDEFEKNYDEAFGEHARIIPSNVISTRALEVKTPDVTVKVSPERSDLIKTEIIDGVKYILIRADDGVCVNGVDISIN